ncbi:MAG: alginate export family protein, partial [Thermoanaerobaculia bacterium]
LEGGYNFAGDRKLRGGLFVSSGDDDPADDEHGTFFQVLPTPRAYARFPFYNAMNSKDAFVQYSMKPHTKVTLVSELHFLKLTEDRDLWYAGGGAFEDRSFGFAGRPANGSDDLARVLDVSVDYAMNPKTSFTAYAGFARGGDVVDAIFDDESARFVYVEVTRRF